MMLHPILPNHASQRFTVIAKPSLVLSEQRWEISTVVSTAAFAVQSKTS